MKSGKDIQNAIESYYALSELKSLIRQGAVQWKVKTNRFESVAEHIALTESLAIFLANQLDLSKSMDMGYLLTMINLHEVGELKIGDLTIYDVKDRKEKHAKELEHAKVFFGKLKNSKYYVDIIDDFNNGKSFEAKFARACDKLENVLEFKKYCDNKQVSLENGTKEMLEMPKVKSILDKGVKELDDLWFIYHLPNFEEFGISQKVWQENIKPIDTNKNTNKAREM